MKKIEKRYVTVELIRRANRALMEGKKFAPHIEAAAARLPRLTAKEINAAWEKVNEARNQ